MIVSIVVPSGEMVHADFSISLAQIAGFTNRAAPTLKTAIVNPRSSLVQRGRHIGVIDSMKINADKILFLDSDMLFPYNTLMRLLAHKKPIVGADYLTRREPFHGTAKDVTGQCFDHTKLSGLAEAKYLATGCLLVDTEVFRKIGEPYFNVAWVNGDFMGEDYNFCEQARALGYPLYCDLDLSKEIAHYGIFPLLLNHEPNKAE